jgi:hypothetical protein
MGVGQLEQKTCAALYDRFHGSVGTGEVGTLGTRGFGRSGTLGTGTWGTCGSCGTWGRRRGRCALVGRCVRRGWAAALVCRPTARGRCARLLGSWGRADGLPGPGGDRLRGGTTARDGTVHRGVSGGRVAARGGADRRFARGYGLRPVVLPIEGDPVARQDDPVEGDEEPERRSRGPEDELRLRQLQSRTDGCGLRAARCHVSCS